MNQLLHEILVACAKLESPLELLEQLPIAQPLHYVRRHLNHCLLRMVLTTELRLELGFRTKNGTAVLNRQKETDFVILVVVTQIQTFALPSNIREAIRQVEPFCCQVPLNFFVALCSVQNDNCEYLVR